MQEGASVVMRCYDCAIEGKAEEAVGVCTSCGRATCLEHGKVQHVPQYRRSQGGIGGPIVRAGVDRTRWVCRECKASAAGAARRAAG
jgi:hypothetical protein